MEIIVREAKRGDAGDIISFQERMAMETENMTLDHDIITRGVTAVFDQPSRGRYFVAEKEGRVIASLMITYEWSDWRASNVWWFQSVFVVPEERRNGVFRSMYDHIRKMGDKEGIAGLRLYVESGNVRAQKTYEAMGMNGDHYRMYEWLR